jgi:hypothetical protein
MIHYPVLGGSYLPQALIGRVSWAPSTRISPASPGPIS